MILSTSIVENSLIIILASNRNETIEKRLWLPIIDDMGVLSFLIKRIQDAGFYRMCIVTSLYEEDDIFVSYAEQKNTGIVRGFFYDVPERMLSAAINYDAEYFVRINATNPLVDISTMIELIDSHIKGNYDYSYNEHRDGVMWGTGCDVFRTEYLKKLINGQLTQNQKETIGQYIIQKNDGRILKYKHNDKCPGYKLSLSTKKDYEVIREIVKNVSEYTQSSLKEYLDQHPVLAKYNIDIPPKETGIEKLFFSPNKVDNILHKRLPDMEYPISVELTLTNKCNLACVYCSDRDLRHRQGISEQLDITIIKRLFDDLSSGGTKGIVIEGGGEPTMHSEFSEVVNYAHQVGLAVGLITNGTSSMDKEMLEKFEWIRVSLDASTEKEYLELKGVDLFEKVISNISLYAKYCKTVGVGYVVTKSNLSCLESLVIRLRENGISYVQCRPVVDSPELYPDGIDLSYLKYYECAGFSVDVDGMKENATRGNGGLPCFAHSITSIISGDGSVYICGRLNIYDWLKPIGNIKEKSFRRIWYSEERQNQSEMIADSDFCERNCPQCRISKFNQLFHRLDSVKSLHFI